jgi:hypothetical protein
MYRKVRARSRDVDSRDVDSRIQESANVERGTETAMGATTEPCGDIDKQRGINIVLAFAITREAGKRTIAASTNAAR